LVVITGPEPEFFKTFKEPKNRFQGIDSARLCSLAGQYDNPIPTLFLAPIDCLKIPAQNYQSVNVYVDSEARFLCVHLTVA
jgi:hypothetical protein